MKNQDAIQRSVFCQYRWEDFHCRPEAPKEVEFLKSIHRHEFHIKLEVSVNHDNRDIEFILLKRRLIKVIHGDMQKELKDNKSCEMIGVYIINQLRTQLVEPDFIRVTVSEDGENGAVLSYTKIKND